MRRGMFSGLGSVVAIVGALGCSTTSSGLGTSADAGDAPDATVTGTGVLKPNVVVLPDSVAATATVAATTITFPAAGNESLATAAPGTILVSGYGDGFLVKVQSVMDVGGQSVGLHPLCESGCVASIVLSVLPASLTDALSSATFDWTFAPMPLTESATEALAGTAANGWSIDGNMTLAPSIEVSGQIQDGSFASFQTVFTTALSDTVTETLQFSGTKTWQGSAPLGSASQRFIEYLPTVPPFPVVGKVILSAVAGYTASISAKANVSISETCSVTHTDTIAYDPASGWQADSEQTKMCTVPAPMLDLEATATATAYFSPTLSLAFYGVGGPSLSAKVAATATITTCPPPAAWNVEGDVTGTLGAQLSVLGISKTFSTQIASFSYPIANGDFSPPEDCGCCDAQGQCQPGTSDIACGTGGEKCEACESPDTCGGGAKAQECDSPTGDGGAGDSSPDVGDSGADAPAPDGAVDASVSDGGAQGPSDDAGTDATGCGGACLGGALGLCGTTCACFGPGWRACAMPPNAGCTSYVACDGECPDGGYAEGLCSWPPCGSTCP